MIAQYSTYVDQKFSSRFIYCQYIMEFLAANCRCELKTKLACSVGKQNFYLIAELKKGHEHVANRLLLLVLKLAFVLCFSRL